MNSQELPQWTEDLSASGRPASAPPAAFLAAVRARRIKRRVGQSMVVGAVLMIALAVSMWPSTPQTPAREIATGEPPVAVPHINSEPPDRSLPAPSARHPGAVTLVTFYVTGAAEDRDSGSVERDSAPVLRGGDRWDLDRVRAWVLN